MQCLGLTGFASAHDVCAFLVYIAQVPRCCAGELSEAGPGLSSALLRSKPLRFRFSGTPQRHRLCWACVLCPSQVPAAQVPRCLRSTLSPGGAGRLTAPPSQPLGFAVSGVPCVSSGELISGCDPPGGRPLSRVPGRKTRLATGSLQQFGRGCRLWGRDCPFPALAATRLPPCLRRGMGRFPDG